MWHPDTASISISLGVGAGMDRLIVPKEVMHCVQFLIAAYEVPQVLGFHLGDIRIGVERRRLGCTGEGRSASHCEAVKDIVS